MDFTKLDKIKTKNKKQLINEICLMYKKMEKQKMIAEKAQLILSDSGRVNSKILNSQAVSIFETILEIMPKEQKEVIVRDFINKEDYFWYLEKYSKTKYYQIKNAAMNNFLYLFYK